MPGLVAYEPGFFVLGQGYHEALAKGQAAHKLMTGGKTVHKKPTDSFPPSLSAAAEVFASRRAERHSPLGHLLILACRFEWLRPRSIEWICRLEGGQMNSQSFRDLMARYYHVRVGRYSYGPLLSPGCVPPGTTVGSYCSIGPGVLVFRRNHPTTRISQHPFFFNAACGFLSRDSIPAVEDVPLRIENDVWIGANAVILPRCRRIGNGAVLGAGAVATADVPDFAIVTGNPAQVLRTKFDEETRGLILQSRWWEHSLEELSAILPLFLENANPVVGRKICDYFVSLRSKRPCKNE